MSLTAALQNPGGTTIPDLSSPSLASNLCSPAHALPIQADEGTIMRGPLTVDGNFVLVTGYSCISGPTNETYLERCGSRLHRFITTTPPESASLLASASHVILWPTGTQQLGGIFLPSLRRFTLTVPNRLARILATQHAFPEPFLTTRHLYLPVGQQVWSTPIPVVPPLRLLCPAAAACLACAPAWKDQRGGRRRDVTRPGLRVHAHAEGGCQPTCHERRKSADR